MRKTSKQNSSLLWWIAAGVALIYLINPTAGILELIPDNIPLIGNLDEAGATWLLLTAFSEIKGD